MTAEFRTLADAVAHHAARSPLAVALADHRTRVSWEQLDQRASQVAHALLSDGLMAGDRVAVLDRNSLEMAELLIGCAKAGTVLAPINSRLQPGEVAAIIRSVTPRLIVVHEELASTMRAALAECPDTTAPLIVIEGESSGARTYASWSAANAVGDLPPSDEELSCICHTSGTTGNPKGVALTHRSLLALHPDTTGEWKTGPLAIAQVAMPLFNIGGLAWLTSNLTAGAQCVILRNADADTIMDSIEEHRVTHFNVVQTVMQMMLQAQHERGRDVSSLQFASCGGSPLRAAHLRDAWETFGCRVLTVYGLSEAGGLAAHHYLEPEYLEGVHEERLRSAGRPVTGMSIDILDVDSSAPVAPGEVGEIAVRGPSLMAGYWQDTEATRSTFTADGWLRTGDIGRVDEDGFLYVLDRLKDVIISGGSNIYASEVEDVITLAEGVAEAAVIGVPHEKWGETPRALVVLRPGAAVTEADVISWTRERLAHYKCPTQVAIVDALPRTPTGKIDKKVLRADPGREL